MYNETIRQRMSIRKYDQGSLDEATLASVQKQMAQVKPLYPDINYSIEIVAKTRGLFGIQAPHYLVFRSEEKAGFGENIGFIGQQMDLFFSASGIGSCWLGMAKPEKSDPGALPFVISMAFGKPAEALHRSMSEFKRKPLTEISSGNDERLEAARLAPSGMNAQNWFFVAQDGCIHCYYKKAMFGLSKLARIDLGIAICHLAQESETFDYSSDAVAPELRGWTYSGTVIG